jgi:hypothetical protein
MSTDYLTEDGFKYYTSRLEQFRSKRKELAKLLSDATNDRISQNDGVVIQIRNDLLDADKRINNIQELLASATLILKKDRKELEVDKARDEDVLGFAVIDQRIKIIPLARDSDYRFVNEKVSQIHNILYTVGSQIRIFKSAIEELEHLINSPGTHERDFHNFFIQHPDFIKGDEYASFRSKVVLETGGNEFEADFMLEPINQKQLWDILELKLPRAKILVSEERYPIFSQPVQKAIAQLREYRNFFNSEENREKVFKNTGIRAFKPKLILLMGKRELLNPFDIRRQESENPDVSLITYDDLVFRAKNKLNRLA